jgi:hypothetical protein
MGVRVLLERAAIHQRWSVIHFSNADFIGISGSIERMAPARK